MAKRKIKTHSFLLKMSNEDYEKLILLCGENYTYTEILLNSLRGNYYNKYKTNELPKKFNANLTTEEREKIELANINWLEGDNQ